MSAGLVIPLCNDDDYVVYAFRGSDGRVLYVGQTAELFERIGDHKRNAPWAANAATVEVLIEVGSRDEALYEERRLIAELRPKHNWMAPVEADTRRTCTPVDGSRLEAVGHERSCGCEWCQAVRRRYALEGGDTDGKLPALPLAVKFASACQGRSAA